MTDQPHLDDIPASIRALLGPYVNVDGVPSTAHQRQLHRTYIAPRSRPSISQLQAIGRVTSTWSVLEHVIEIALARLALAPDFPALALTNDLGIDNRIKALRALIALHHERYREQIIPHALIETLQKLPGQIATLKDQRNRVTHLVWTRWSETRMSDAPRALTESAASKAPIPTMDVEEINALADRIQAMSDLLFIIAQLMPEVDEGSLAQSLSLLARRPPRETQ